MHSPRPVLVYADDDRRLAPLAEPARIVHVHHRTAREHPVVEPLRIDRDRQLPPVHQVLAHRVTPVHIAPLHPVRIVLVVQVPEPLVEHQPVGVVIPPPPGREMELRPQRLPIQILRPANLVRLLDQIEPVRTRRQPLDLDRRLLARKRRQVQKHPEVRRPAPPARSRTRARPCSSTIIRIRRFGAPFFTGRFRYRFSTVNSFRCAPPVRSSLITK